MKLIILQIVNNNYINNLLKIFSIPFLSIEMIKLASRLVEINGNLYFTQHWDGEISQNLTLF